MRSLTFSTYVTTPADLDVSRISDLALGANNTLYATTNYDGWVSAWSITGTGLSLLDQDNHTAALSAGAVPGLAFVTKNGSPALLSGGHNGGNMSLRTLASDGSFATLTNLGSGTRLSGPLTQPERVDLSTGDIAIYGGITGGGIAQLTFDANGTLQNTATTASAQIAALTSTTIAGTSFVFTASDSDTGVSAWAVGTSGTLTLRATITPDTGLWVSAPTALATAQINGDTYVVLAAAGSGSLSVLQVGLNGALTVVDHLLDDRNSRFAGATVVETVTHDGLTYVMTGGADDGISVYALLAGGRLLPRAHIADTTDMGLANISAIAVQARGTGLDIFAASGTEPGLTRLRYEAGNGILVTGTATAEALTGTAGDDILFDGGGSDTLFGGAGADTFVMAADGVADTIRDFTPGVDTIDLSGWNGLRSIDQLFFATTNNGLTITYGTETLVIVTATGASLAGSALTDTDLLGGARIPQTITPGLPGPVTTPPPLPERPVIETPVTPAPLPESGIERLGTGAADILTGTTFDDTLWGLAGRDTLSGGDGDDMLYGGSDGDRLTGGAGDDWLIGGAGRDSSWTANSPRGSSNADILYGDSGDDHIFGNAGTDRIWGGAGNDMLTGGAGRDIFVFTAGQDRITDFNPVVDTILLDTDLWSGNRSADALVATFASTNGTATILDFGNGNILQLDDLGGLADLAQAIAFL